MEFASSIIISAEPLDYSEGRPIFSSQIEIEPNEVSFLRFPGAFVSDKLPIIGADSGVEALLSQISRS